MKKLITLLVVLVTAMLSGGSVEANHHRAHALFFLDDLVSRVRQINTVDIPALRTVSVLSNAQAEHRLYEISLMIDETLIVIEDLNEALHGQSCFPAEASTVLAHARGMVNAPKKGLSGTSSNGKTLAGQGGRISYRIGQFINDVDLDEVDQDVLARMIRRWADAWVEIDSVIWHVNDAYREEVAGEAGAGHDPLIDPVGLAMPGRTAQQFIFNPCGG